MITALLIGGSRKTLSSAIILWGLDQEDWSADYRLFSRSEWEMGDLFHGVLEAAVSFLPPSGPNWLALDDTGLPKEGQNMHFARWIHDPLAPPWQRPGLHWGIPMLHASLLLPANASRRATSVSLAFEPIPPPAHRAELTGGKRGRPRKIVPIPGSGAAPAPPLASKTPPTATQLAVGVICRIRDVLGRRDREVWRCLKKASRTQPRSLFEPSTTAKLL